MSEEENNVLLAVKSKKDEGQFVTNVPTTRICPRCPVVVFTKQELEKAAKLSVRNDKQIQYSVIGLIDMSEDQESINESIIEFGNIMGYKKPLPRIASPKIGRNEKCPCGSGKKYKKCCIKSG